VTTNLANTNPLPLINDGIRSALITREKALIAKAQDMVRTVRAAGGWDVYTYHNLIKLAKARLEALQAGLVPVRLGGPFTGLRTLVNSGQYIPAQIVAKSVEVAERFPDAQQRVYGWQENATTEIRRRRDPVLTAFIGEAEFFLGFWLEVEVPDDAVPEFFGFLAAPLLPKLGRGRPRKM
jgi:hypothetical protein